LMRWNTVRGAWLCTIVPTGRLKAHSIKAISRTPSEKSVSAEAAASWRVARMLLVHSSCGSATKMGVKEIEND
jgi:hypothetical protein